MTKTNSRKAQDHKRRTESIVKNKREIKLRTRRVSDLNLNIALKATGHHHGLGNFEAEVIDLSLHGARLKIPSTGAHSLVLIGDRIKKLNIFDQESTFYTNVAQVRHVGYEERAIVLGLELKQSLDLGAIYRANSRLTFSNRFGVAERKAKAETISQDFKAWVADCENYLSEVKDFLDAEESILAQEDALTREETLGEYLASITQPVIRELNMHSVRLAKLVSHLDAEAQQHHRIFSRRHIVPLLLHSPFIKRAYEKPLGYAGDFEMMNMLFRDHFEGDSLFGKVINAYASQELASRAVINRASFVATKIRSILKERSTETRAVNLGCGPAQELNILMQNDNKYSRLFNVMLIDQDSRAIAHCERTIAPKALEVGMSLRLFDNSIRSLLSVKDLKEALDSVDLVYSTGLFDYVSDRTFVVLLSALFRSINPGGTMIIGNMTPENPSRWVMDYHLDWQLIYRTREQLIRLGEQITPKPVDVSVEQEPTGVNLFLVVKKAMTA